MSETAPNIIPFLRPESEALTILAVEDDRIEKMFLEQQIRELGHNILSATNGQEAIDLLRQADCQVDIVLMDRLMPVMDGMTAVRLMKEDRRLSRIPVVMVTGASGEKEMQEGLDAGVFYYLAKPARENILKSVLAAATREVRQGRVLHEELKKHKNSFNLIETCKFRYRTVEEAESLAAFAAYCFPDPVRVLPGLAHLLVNAVEHGICEIGYERKGQLIETGTLRAELQRRQSQPGCEGRMIEAVIAHKDNGVYAVITDPGPGFNWKKYLSIEPARASDNHGRGIAQARALSFDKLTYNEMGNQAIAYVSGIQNLDW